MAVRDILKQMWQDFKRIGEDPYSAIVFTNRTSGQAVTLYCSKREAESIAARLRDEILKLSSSSDATVEVRPEAAAEWNAAFHSLVSGAMR